VSSPDVHRLALRRYAELLNRLLRRPWVFVLPLLGILDTGAPPVGVTRCCLGWHILDPIPGLFALLLLFVHGLRLPTQGPRQTCSKYGKMGTAPEFG
jgi:hypothetical protein